MQVLRPGQHAAQAMLRPVVDGDELAEGSGAELISLIDDEQGLVGRKPVQVFRDELQEGRDVRVAALRYTAGTLGKLHKELAGVPFLGLDEDDGAGEVAVEEMLQRLGLSAARLVRDGHPHAFLFAGVHHELNLAVVGDGGYHLPAVLLIPQRGGYLGIHLAGVSPIFAVEPKGERGDADANLLRHLRLAPQTGNPVLYMLHKSIPVHTFLSI